MPPQGQRFRTGRTGGYSGCPAPHESSPPPHLVGEVPHHRHMAPTPVARRAQITPPPCRPGRAAPAGLYFPGQGSSYRSKTSGRTAGMRTGLQLVFLSIWRTVGEMDGANTFPAKRRSRQRPRPSGGVLHATGTWASPASGSVSGSLRACSSLFNKALANPDRSSSRAAAIAPSVNFVCLQHPGSPCERSSPRNRDRSRTRPPRPTYFAANTLD